MAELTYLRQLTIPTDKWHANDDGSGAGFGGSIAVDNTKVICGCPTKYHNGGYYGAAYVYDWDGTFIQEILPEAADRAGFPAFAQCLALSGEWLIVGIANQDVVCFYQWNGTTFDFKQRLAGSTTVAGDYFGYNVAIDGSVAAVGATSDDDAGSSTGNVFIFRESGGTWSQDQNIQAPDASCDNFGYSIAIDGTVMAVGDPYYDDTYTNEGRVFIYEESGGTFTKTHEATQPAAGGTNVDPFFGSSLGISGTDIFIGWRDRQGDTYSDAGAIAVWRKSGTWAYSETLVASPESVGTNAELGGWGGNMNQGSVHAAGNWCVGGARGWENPESGSGWWGAGFLWKLDGSTYTLEDYVFPAVVGEWGVHIAVDSVSEKMALGGYSADSAQSASYPASDSAGVVRLYDFAEPTNPYFGLSFDVSRIDVVRTTPVPRLQRNEFDELGELLSLPRRKSEKNWEYRRRIFDAYANKANSSYRGLINGITRELNLSIYPALIINPRTEDGVIYADDPYVKVEGAFIYLYSDYANGVLDHKIDRYEPGGNFEHLYRLVEFINTTIYWEAHMIPGVDNYTRSMVLLNQSNRVYVDGEKTAASSKYRLKKSRIVSGSLWFEDRDFYREEVLTEAEVGSVGTYHVDYTNGIITCAQVSPWTIARYQYMDFPFKVLASPVILYDINLDSFKEKMFEQILQDDGTYEHGLPTKLGADQINELLSVHPMYWGI
jgi:hypothetical protein